MAIRRPLVITSTGDAELPAGDTLPVSMQDTYDNTATSGGYKTVTLDAAAVITHELAMPSSGLNFAFRYVDTSGVYQSSGYYQAGFHGLNLDLGQHITLNCYGSGPATFQATFSNGTYDAPTQVLAHTPIVTFQGYARDNAGGVNYGATITARTSEDHTTTNAGVEWTIGVVKNGTPKTQLYDAVRVTNDGNVKVFRDFKARSSYNCPFIIYALPAPYNHTGTATETKISSDIPVPANMLGVNSKLKTDILTSCTTTANGKYVVVRFGPNANNTDPIMLYFNFGGVLSQHIFDTLTCRNSNTDKIGFLSYTSSSIGTSSTSKSIAMQAISVNNTIQNYITVWLKNGQTTDDSTLQMLTIEVIP